LLAVAFAVRILVVFVALHRMPIVSDAGEYTDQARALLHHMRVGAYYWPPGQSYFLTAVFKVAGDSDTVAKASNIVVDVANAVLAVLLARRLLVDSRAIRLTGWLLALFPSTILMSGQPYSISLTMLCLLAAALLLLQGHDSARWPYFPAAGALLGFAVLTRPSTLSVLLALIIVAAVVGRGLSRRRDRRRLRALAVGSVLFIAAAAAVVAPTVHHNADRGQGLTVSTANEQNFWFGNNPYTPAYKTWQIGAHPVREFPPEERRYLLRYGIGSPARAQRHEMLREAARFIVHHPAITALRTFDRAQSFWGFDYTPSNDVKHAYRLARPQQFVLTALEAIAWIAVGLLALVGLTEGRSLIRRPVALFMLAIVVSYALP
jgi:4-amino-4-deoxy-L-arabinose transferase-like glycosyltransferase